MPVPADTDAVCQKARELIRKRQFAEAIEVYRQGLEANERDVRAHEGIATVAFLLQDYELAAKHFKRVSQLDLRRADPLVNLGAVYNRQGEFGEAVRTLRQALSKNRKCAEAYYNLGIAYRGQNQLSMAISAYKEAIRLAPEMAEAYQNLGNAFVEMGSVQQAINNFRRALEINPHFERAKRGLEAAQRQAQVNAHEANPFGRLVDVKQMAAQSGSSPAPQLRELTDEERQQDRAIIHRIAVTFDEHASHALISIKDSLGPALLTLLHALAQSDDRGRLVAAHDSFVDALEKHRQAISPLLRCADDLQAHEEEQIRICKRA